PSSFTDTHRNTHTHTRPRSQLTVCSRHVEPVSGAKFDVSITEIKSNTVISFLTAETSNGTHVVNYTPTVPGVYRVNIDFEGAPIPKSPFRVSVRFSPLCACYSDVVCCWVQWVCVCVCVANARKDQGQGLGSEVPNESSVVLPAGPHLRWRGPR